MFAVDHVRNAIAVEQALDDGQLAYALCAGKMNHLHMRPTDDRLFVRSKNLPIDCTFPPIPLHSETSYGVSVIRACRSRPGPPEIVSTRFHSRT